jgi:uncharacterized membrane protein YsdA (DUF1294 family)/cold shock CspA family protein
MRFEGVVKNWNDDRGFGFIEPAKGGQELFVHVKAFPMAFGRPTVGTKVTFEVEPTNDGKKRAIKVQPISAAKPATTPSNRRASTSKGWETSSIVALAFFGVSYLVLTLVWKLPLLVGAAYLGMSIVCAGFYWHDKVSARRGEWRTSEGALILMGTMCGWPGAIVAQQLLRHKTTKQSFRTMHWFSVGLNLTVLMVVGTPVLGMLLKR